MLNTEKENIPLVSICCITYNHVPFIRQCLDGFLMQETSFPIEILVHDDCSTDGTTEIIKEYATRYPDKIFPLYEEENQYSKGVWVDGFNYCRAKGKYVAYCEGDDYWTDPLKLQKQVDFMEAHPDYSVCFHEFTTTDVKTGQSYVSQYPTEGDYDITPKMLIMEPYNIAQPLTMMYRKLCFSLDWKAHYTYYRDTMETFHLLHEGKGRFMRFNGGVYNRHDGGVCTSMRIMEMARITLTTYIEMYLYSGDEFLRTKICDTCLWSIQQVNKKERIRLIMMVWHKIPVLALKTVFVYVKRKLKAKLWTK